MIDISLRYYEPSAGVSLYYQHWIPENPKSLLVFVHDLGDHLGRYTSFIKYFIDNNYAVALYDQRGHGRSRNKKFSSSARFEDYISDLSKFLCFSRSRVKKELPVFLIGQGFGAQIIINLLVPGVDKFNDDNIINPGEMAGFVTLSAYIAPIIKGFHIDEYIKTKLSKIYPHWLVKSIINPENLSNNPDVIRNYTRDNLVTRRMSLTLKQQILSNTEFIIPMSARIRIPALMLHGKKDQISAYTGTSDFVSRLPSISKKMHLYEDYKHDLMNELDNQIIFKDIENWLQNNITVFSNKDKKVAKKKKESLCDLPLFSLQV